MHTKKMRNLLKSTLLAVALSAAASSAHAGTGATDGTIRSAVRSGNADAIISALEQAEDLPCNSECMGMVMDLLEDDDYRIRQVAAWWFARRPAQMKEVAERAEAWLSVGDSTQARNGADILGTFGYKKFIPVLSQAAAKASLSSDARAAVVQALGNIANMEANPVVAQAMTDESSQVRLAAVNAWRNMLKQSSAAPVAALVADTDTQVRRAAVSTVGTFRESTARADLEVLVVSDPDPAVRRNAAWALGRIGDASSREALRTAATDSSSLVRTTAKVAISKLR